MKKELTIEENFDLAVKNHNEGNYQLAIDCYEKIIKIDSTHIASSLNLSSIALLHKKNETAKKYLALVLKNDPNNIMALNNLGAVYMQNKDYKEAEFLFKKIIDLNPKYVAAYFNLAKISEKSGYLNNAVVFLRKVLEIEPNYLDALVYAGNIHTNLKQYSVAKDLYTKAIAIDPNSQKALIGFGVYHHKIDEYEDALNLFNKLISINPNSVLANNAIGNVFFTTGDYKKAKISFEKTIKLDPNFTLAYSNLGLCFDKLGDKIKAKTNIEKSLSLEPNNINFLSNAFHLYIKDFDVENSIRISHKNLKISHQIKNISDQGITAFRLKHDVQQAEYLISKDYKINGIKEFQKVGQEILDRDENKNEKMKSHEAIKINQNDTIKLAPYLKELIIYSPKKISSSCINPNKNWQDVEDEYFNSSNQIMYIDDFLSEEAVSELRKFCLISKIWNREYNKKYLGAFSEMGFISSLHMQIAHDLKIKLPKLFGPHKINKFWGFKYDSTLGGGINIHADFAIHNLNFWITPDKYNNNKNNGGLKVYDAPAPDFWTFKDYNKNYEKIYEFLKDNNAKCTNIPYKFNRAVLFNSAYFHETDEIDFKDEYEGRRINNTYLFGDRIVKVKTNTS